MGMYTSYAYHTYKISREEYNYLLPVYGLAKSFNGFTNENNIFERNGHYYFVGTHRDYDEMRDRLRYL